MTLELFATADGGALVGSRCRRCRHVAFPRRAVCEACGAEDTEQALVGRRGTIRASAVVRHAPLGFQAPYVVGLVELDEGPIVFCPITGASTEHAPPAGTPVELVIAPARPGGAPVFQYRPA